MSKIPSTWFMDAAKCYIVFILRISTYNRSKKYPFFRRVTDPTSTMSLYLEPIILTFIMFAKDFFIISVLFYIQNLT